MFIFNFSLKKVKLCLKVLVIPSKNRYYSITIWNLLN